MTSSDQQGTERGRGVLVAAGFDHRFVKPVDNLQLAHVLANVAPGRS